jgi:acyl carrier protein
MSSGRNRIRFSMVLGGSSPVSGINTDELMENLKVFICNNFPIARQRGVTLDDRLLDDGFVDSLGLLVIVEHLEDDYQIAVDDDALQVENFGSIRAIANYVADQLKGTPSA